MPEKNNNAEPAKRADEKVVFGSAQDYRLERFSKQRKKTTVSVDCLAVVTAKHVRSLCREIDDQINFHQREVIVTASRFCSVVRCKTSHARLASFQIVGAPIFDGDIDDTDSLDVSALRRKLNGERKR